jgi:hypothetical protein
VRPVSLKQIASCPGPHRREDEVVIVEHGEDEYSGRGPGATRSGGVDAVEAGHLDVHNHDVGLALGRGGGSIVTVAASPTTGRRGIQQGPLAGQENRVVVGEQDAHQFYVRPSLHDPVAAQ